MRRRMSKLNMNKQQDESFFLYDRMANSMYRSKPEPYQSKPKLCKRVRTLM